MALLTNIESEKPEIIYSKLRQLWRIEENFEFSKPTSKLVPSSFGLRNTSAATFW